MFTRLANGNSKQTENQVHAFSLCAMVYILCRPHGVLTRERGIRTTPALAVGLECFACTVLDVVERMDPERKLWAEGPRASLIPPPRLAGSRGG